MRNTDLRRDQLQCPFLFTEPSYESYLFSQLYELHCFLEAEGQSYAFFGGVAIAAYSNHFPRTLHDLDLIIPEGEENGIVSYLFSQSFKEITTKKTLRARFRKFVFEDDRYQIIVAVFPGKFTLINLGNTEMPVIGIYDFGPALQRRTHGFIHALGGQGVVPATTVPIEDLIITKLWPTLEPKLIHDLILLLGSDAAKDLDTSYLRERIKQSESLRAITLQTLNRFLSTYEKSLWSKGLPGQEAIERQIYTLINLVDSSD